MSDMKFIDGLRAYRPHENAPDFVKAALVISVEELGKFLRKAYQEGQTEIRVDVKEGRSGNWYASENTFKPQESTQSSAPPAPDDSVPF